MLASAVWIIPALFATIEASIQWRLNGWDRPSLREILFSGGDWLVYGLLTPIGSDGSEYSPCSLDTVELVAPVAACLACTMAPGTAAPPGSVTVPFMLACGVCPKMLCTSSSKVQVRTAIPR